MADFKVPYEKTGLKEGGWADHPSDRGKQTICGISQRSHPNLWIWGQIDKWLSELKIPNSTYKQKKDHIDKLWKESTQFLTFRFNFYKEEYWDKVRGDQIPLQDVAEELYDSAVLHGPKQAIIFLQRSLNLLNRNQKLYPDTSIDGSFGPGTWRTFEAYMASVQPYNKGILLVEFLNSYQKKFFIEFTERNPEQEDFIVGQIMQRTRS